jgi:hypothetical protein
MRRAAQSGTPKMMSLKIVIPILSYRSRFLVATAIQSCCVCGQSSAHKARRLWKRLDQSVKTCLMALVILLSSWAAIELPCTAHCAKSTCCSFSDPAKECAGCGSDAACNPNTKCYRLEDRPPSTPPFNSPTGTCEWFCEKASCCGFSDPVRSCAGCGSEYLCHPGAECYVLAHQHTPKQSEKLNRKHEHVPRDEARPPARVHDHAPAGSQGRKGAAPARKLHQHSPDSSKTPSATPTNGAGNGGGEDADHNADATKDEL